LKTIFLLPLACSYAKKIGNKQKLPMTR